MKFTLGHRAALVLFVIVLASSCAPPALVTQCQTTGADTNCYLLYDSATLEAALIDVGGEIDELLDTIREEGLQLRYILATHGHTDHVIGIPDIRADSPRALTCMHELAYTDLLTLADWILENLPPEVLEAWRRDPEFRKLTEFDAATLGEPDRFLAEGDELELGRHTIRVLHCPGHSRGGLCYAVDDLLFSGDVLFRGTVGRVDLQNASREAQIASVRRLYEEFPDETIVYPGHGEPTTIGHERVNNELVSETEVGL